MRPRTGFALVRYPAARRRQDPPSEAARSEWGPADRALRCTSNYLQFSEAQTPEWRAPARRAEGPNRMGLPSVRSVVVLEGCEWNHRSVRPESIMKACVENP